ncbi:MAG: AgmX/PglI C-terminal domain-containing protein [Kofleriaceae bacterium]
MKPVLLALLFVGCGAAAKTADTPAGPVEAEAPPTSGTEATAPPQPAPELAHPVLVENAVISGSNNAPPPEQQQLQPPPGKLGAPKITRGKPELSNNAIDQEVVTRYLNKNSANFQLCYEHELLVNPAITGNVGLMFTITPSGNVTKVNTTGNMDPGVEKCVTDVALKIQFPAVKKSVDVTYPMTFEWR